MEWMTFTLGIAALILGTGWLFTYRAYKRKNEGEATQAEAEGWKSVQEVYQETIEDLKKICDEVRDDRNHLRDDRNMLRKENEEFRVKFKGMEEEIRQLKNDMARQGRKLEALSPFLCGVVGCLNRVKVDMGLNTSVTNQVNDSSNE